VTSEVVGTSAPLLGEPVAVELMNTIWADRSGVHDALADGPAHARAWLAAVGASIGLANLSGVRDDLGLVDADTSPDATGRGVARDLPSTFVIELMAIRDALRRLAAEATSDPRERARGARELEESVRALNTYAAGSLTWPELTWDRSQDRPSAQGRTRASEPLSRVVVAVLARAGVAFFADDTARTGLRACLAPGCVLYFVKQHPRREWCSIACGNRARAARHYQRHR